jgi:hypothetical protein
MSYSLLDYGRMISDHVRTDAFLRALTRAVHADSVVVDIGTGTGSSHCRRADWAPAMSTQSSQTT